MDSYLPPSYQSILITFALLGFLVGCRSDMVRDQPFDCDLTLIDLAQNKLVLQYSTRLEVDRWPEFQKQLEAFLPRH